MPQSTVISMSLKPGQRLTGSGRAVYVVRECLQESSSCRLYSAHKVFRNYRYDDRSYYEAAEDEWVEVRIRACPKLEPHDSARQNECIRRLEYEASEVLTTHPAWLPAPIDRLDHNGEPLLVMSTPHGDTFRHWRESPNSNPARRLRAASEMLHLLESLHRSGQILGGFGPDDFVIDTGGRLCLIAGNRVRPAEQSKILGPSAGDEVLTDGFLPPEAALPGGSVDARTDIYSWARLFLFLMTGLETDGPNACDEQPNHFTDAERSEFITAMTALAETSPKTLRSLTLKTDRRAIEDVVLAWGRSLDHCLAADPHDRPGSIAELRKLAMAPEASYLTALWKRLGQALLGRDR
jgi:serine/threonine protein kinase